MPGLIIMCVNACSMHSMIMEPELENTSSSIFPVSHMRGPKWAHAYSCVVSPTFKSWKFAITKPTHYTVYHYAAISSQMTITQPDWQCLKAAVSSGQMAATNTASY